MDRQMRPVQKASRDQGSCRGVDTRGRRQDQPVRVGGGCSPVRGRRRRDEEGSVTAFVMLVSLALLVAGGLVIDGGETLAARRQAIGQAEQAARVGADSLDTARLREGQVQVDPGLAAAASRQYLTQVGAEGTIRIDDGVLTVEVTEHPRMAILSAVGLTTLTVHGRASATSIDQDTRPGQR